MTDEEYYWDKFWIHKETAEVIEIDGIGEVVLSIVSCDNYQVYGQTICITFEQFDRDYELLGVI